MASIVTGLIEQVKIDAGANQSIASTAYGVCNTLSDQAAKTVEMTGFKLITGVTVHIKFTYSNAAENPPTLNINNTGAKPIVQYGTTGAGINAETNGWQVGAVLSLTYDGTSWVRDQGYNTNTNTWRGIQDNLTSDSATDSLSAKQGKALKGLIDAMDATTPNASGNATAFIDSITQTDGKITSITKKNIPTVSKDTAGLAPKGAAVSTQSTSTKFLREDGTWATPSYTTNVDTKVTQTGNTENKEFSILLKNTNNTSDETNGVKFGKTENKLVTVNPSTGRITAPGGLAGVADSANAVAWGNVSSKPTSIKLTGAVTGSVTLGSGENSITTTVNHTHTYLSSIAWDNSNKKITQSVNGAAATAILEFVAGSNITLTPAAGKLTIANSYSYTLPIALYNKLGGLKPAYTSTAAATLTTAAATNTDTPTIAAKTTTSGRYYAVEADKNGIAYVNVPWTDHYAWGDITGKPTKITLTGAVTGSVSLGAGDLSLATTVNHNHDSTYSYIHLTDYSFTATRPLSKYVTFDKSNPDGAPTATWYNGFISSHNNYLASYIINAHRTDNWYVGYGQFDTSTNTAPAPTWYKLAHSGNVSTGDNNGQVKIAGQNVSVKGLKALAYKDSLTYSDVGAAASNHNHNGTYVPNTTGANDVNTLYNTGIYNITSGSLTNGPVGYGYGQLLVMSYRKHTGNTTTDWAIQLYAHLGNGNNGNTLYFRTSNASTWQTWQMVAHANAGTARGDTKKPIYINAKGEIQEGDALKNLAYKDSLVASDIPNLSWNKITSDKPTTLSGYGITDAKIASGVITLGSNTITPVTSVNGYTGSSVNVTAADLGLSKAMRFIGVATVAITDGSTTDPAISGYSTKTAGDVIIDKDSSREYVWSTTGNWELLGGDSSYKTTQSTVDSGAAATNKWVSRIQQNANGVVTVTMGTLDTSGTWSGNAMSLASTRSIGSSSTTHATALKAEFDANKASIKRNQLIHYYDGTGGNGSATFGYFLSGYDTGPYGGFFSAHYNNAYYIGIQAGTYTQYTLAHSGNVGTGDSNGQVKIAGTNVSVKGLGSAAYTASTAYATAAQGTKADNALPLAGGKMTGGLEIAGHIAGDSGTSGHGLYSGGMYHNAYNNIILHGDGTTGTSGIAFISNKNGTNINQPSDRAFIQYHAYGVTTATAEGTAPTLATSGEAGRFVIGIGNDSGDKIVLQAPGDTDIIHQKGATGYPIPHTTNTNGTVGATGTPVYVEAGVIKAGTALGASAYHADSYFALASHGTHVTTATVKSALGTVSTTAKKFLKDTGDWTQVAWGDLTGVPSSFTPSGHEHNRLNSIGRLTTAAAIAYNPGASQGFRLVWNIYDSSSRTNDATNSPSFDAGVINLPWDWGGYNGQIAISNTVKDNTRMQIRSASHIDNGESANPRYTPNYGVWREVVTATKATQMGSATKPIYISNTGQVVEGTALGGAAYKAADYYAVANHGTHVPASGTTGQFLRGDNTWSNTISGGLFKITNNSNTVTIGSANTSWCHFENSANIPFYFNHQVVAVDGFKVYNTTTQLYNNYLTFSQGGGWYMSDATWIRTYGSKSVYMNTGTFRNDGTTQLRTLQHVNGNIVADGTWDTGATGTANSGDNNATRGTLGTSRLYIGNATALPAAGTAGGANNAKGYLYIYGEGTGAGELTYNDSMFQSNKSIYLSTSTNSGISNELRGICGTNDYWRVAGGATASNAGYMEIATADDATEPIYVRQYTGVFATLKRTLTLLDGSGNSSFPGTVTATKFSGPLTGNVTGNVTGNADTATRLQAPDTRSTNESPSTLMEWGRGITTAFKYRSTVGTPDGSGTYGIIINLTPWGDSSGSRPKQIWVDDSSISIRHSTSNSEWSNWSRVVTNSGTWGISITGSSASCTGNAATATTWQTSRTLTIGNKGQSVNGSGNVSWALQDILIRAGNEFNYTADGIASLWFNYKTQTGTSATTKITEYNFGNGQGSVTGVTLKAAAFSGNAATASAWQYNRNVYINLNTDHSSSSPAVLNASTQNAAALAIGVDGTLPVKHGGTGVTSIAALRTALNISKIYYGTCDTAAGTAAKIVTCSNFVLETGAVIFVQFTNTNTASPTNLSMRINSSNSADSKPIRFQHNDETTPSYLPAAGYIKQNQTYRFHYDGTNYIMDVAYDEDTIMPGIRVYRYATESLGVYDHDLPFLVSSTQTGNIGNGANSGTYTDNVFGVINNNAAYMPTVNVHTGLVKLPSLQVAGKSKFNGIKGSNNVDYGYVLPSSPEEGQIFFQFSSTAYELPAGGTTGQVLVKNSANDRDVKWATTGATLDNTAKYYVAGSKLNTTNTDPLVFNTNIYVQNNVLFGAAWNDYAEKRQCNLSIPGTCVIENDNGKLTPSSERLTPGACIISDTYGMCIGETEKAKVPVAITGRVLAYTYQRRENYHAGMAVCSAPNGTVDIMTREEIRDYPDAIIGIVSEIPEYEYWGMGNVKVDGRIWIKVK